MKRGLLIIGLGLGFLALVTALGTFITNYMPAMKTPQVQTSQAGPYTVTLSVNPNPPSTTQAATLSVQIQQSASHQSVSSARVILEGSQEDMGLSTSAIEAAAQGNGRYTARVSFSMSGSWQMQVSIALPGHPTVNAVFMVTAQ